MLLLENCNMKQDLLNLFTCQNFQHMHTVWWSMLIIDTLYYIVGSLIAETLRISNPEIYALYAITSSSG